MKLAAQTEFRMGRELKPIENGEERDWLCKSLLNTPDEIPQILQEKCISLPPWRKKYGSPNKVIRISLNSYRVSPYKAGY